MSKLLDSRGDLHSLSFERLQDQIRERADSREAAIETETRQQTVSRIEEDYYDGEIISETLPYDKKKWQFFRDEILKYLEGQHCDYLEVGKMFIESAADYAEFNTRCDVKERL